MSAPATSPAPVEQAEAAAPREPLLRLFLRFLRFGFLAWGGPVAQIAMIRQELVERERWVTPQRFNRVLAVYQALPGPEATELCCYFGILSRGRIGAFLAGLAFMLPGFLMMFALAWWYVRFGLNSPLFAAAFLGVQPAVAAMVVRAVHRIGAHAVVNPWLLAIALLVAISAALGVNFFIALAWAGVTYPLVRRGRYVTAALVLVAAAGAATYWAVATGIDPAAIAPGSETAPRAGDASIAEVLIAGFRAGLLTFGGAYTAIPFVQNDAVIEGGWLTTQQFLDGLALGGVLPAPLVIFSTFVGYLGAGAPGAIAMTVGMFLPAFSFTLIGHNLFERLVENRNLHNFLDGVTAGVVGLIAVTAIGLVVTAVTGPVAAAIFAAGLAALYRFKGRGVVPLIVLGSGVVGLILLR